LKWKRFEMKKLYTISICILAAIILLVVAFFVGRATAPPGTPKVVKVTEKITGKLSGQTPAPVHYVYVPAGNQGKLGTAKPAGQEQTIIGDTPVQLQPVQGLLEGDSVTAPVSGPLTVKYTINGKPGGEVQTQIGGTSTVGIEDGLVKFDTKFDGTAQVDLTVPGERRRTFHAGALGSFDGQKFDGLLYGQYDFQLKKYLLMPVRVEYDGNFTYKAGIEMNF
jgi:hypothetical protein